MLSAEGGWRLPGVVGHRNPGNGATGVGPSADVRRCRLLGRPHHGCDDQPPGGIARVSPIESDLLDAIVALPTDRFYNTGIATYVCVLDRKRPVERRGKVQLIDGSQMFATMRKSLGNKRKELTTDDVAALVKLYGAFEDGGDDKRSKVFANEAFGHHTITVERPLPMSRQVMPERIGAAIETAPAVLLPRLRVGRCLP